jgi:hypothetical protein
MPYIKNIISTCSQYKNVIIGISHSLFWSSESGVCFIQQHSASSPPSLIQGFWDRVSPCSPGWSSACDPPCFHRPGAGMIGVHHHTWLHSCILNAQQSHRWVATVLGSVGLAGLGWWELGVTYILLNLPSLAWTNRFPSAPWTKLPNSCLVLKEKGKHCGILSPMDYKIPKKNLVEFFGVSQPHVHLHLDKPLNSKFFSNSTKQFCFCFYSFYREGKSEHEKFSTLLKVI